MAGGGILIKKLEAATVDQVSRFRLPEEDQDLEIFVRQYARNQARRV
jgi:hypothetical protein